MDNGSNNRFSALLKGATENEQSASPKRKKGVVDFGAAIEGNEQVAATFKALQGGLSPNSQEEAPTTTHTTPDRQTVEQSDGQTVRGTSPQTVRQSEPENLRPSDSQQQTIARQTIPQTAPQTTPFDVLNLSCNQATILEFLLTKASGQTSGLTNYKEILDRTNITMPSARDALSRLVTRGFIARPQTYRSAAFQGFSFILNKPLCDIFIAAGGLSLDRYQTVHQTQPQTVRQLDPLTVHSSSRFTTEPTTTENLLHGKAFDRQTVRQSEVAFVMTGPEMAFWTDAGLQERQTQTWCKEFELSPEHLRQQLVWARWDLVENGKDQTVQNAINWLYGIFRRTGGCYPRPDNYASPEEQRLRNMQAEARRREEVREQLRTAEKELEFQEILDDKNAEKYKQLLDKVPTNMRTYSGKMLETTLRSLFMEE